MALYRSDQTQLTFGPEAAPGGYADPVLLQGSAIASSSPYNQELQVAANAGDTSINVKANTNATVGDFIMIGDHTASSFTTAARMCEIRRVENVSGTGTSTIMYLDAPLGFYHAADQDVIQVEAYPVAANHFRANTYLPGVYDTVNLPEPSNAINPSYFLGTGEKRSYTHAYRGAQSLEGSISSFAVLNGWPLRFPIGKVDSSATKDGTDGAVTAAGDFLAKKGDYYIRANTTSFDNNITVVVGDSPNREMKLITTRVSGSHDYLQLNSPLRFDHSAGGDLAQILAAGEAGTGTKFTHSITESTELDTVCWEATFADSSGTAANTLKRRYYGGMVGTATLAAEEGGVLTMSWDSVPFMGMQHNIAEGDLGSGAAGVSLPGYMLMNTDLNRVGRPTGTTVAESYPNTEPYYFSQGTITMFGVVIARIRDFSLSINNNLESRYYIEQRGDNRRRGPSEIHEGRREYSMTCTIVPDAIDATHTASSHTRTVFTEYIGQADASAFGTNAQMTGFAMDLSFIRGPLADATHGNDTITITVPASTDNKPGAILTAAPLQIDGNNPLQTSAEILIRTLSITIEDNEPFYP